ncbi:hypothetical protein [Ensifer aridi]|uniref:hypothetical protein n=1 Tax=Ensifer aridi TaxID=1708715 RepID=UPI000A0F8951|nr:hypothetical protein [Ensifer aridi]
MFENGQTANNYFKAVRRCFEWVALRGVLEPESAEGRTVLCFRDTDAGIPSDRDWQQVVANVSSAILNIGDNTFIDSDQPGSRNKKIEALRAGLERLTEEGIVPSALPEGRLEARGSVAPKCLATLSFEAGRLDIAGLSAKDAYEAFVKRNTDMLDELRRCLWDELQRNLDLFEVGQRLLKECPVQDIRQVEDVLNSTTMRDIRRGVVSSRLALNKEQEFALALKFLQHRAKGGAFNVAHVKVRALVGPIVSHSEAQPYFEATSEALNAAYHIILIDTGGNVQPVDDLPLDLYKGSTRRGRRRLRSLRAAKNRAAGKPVPSNLKDEEELYLSTKSIPGKPSGTAVVEAWKTLSAPMRAISGPTAERLWVWRIPWETKVRTALVSMASERWPAFLERVKDNPLIGGLPITRPIIRKAVANTKGDAGEIEFLIQKALLGHSNAATTFQYLSEGAVRAFLNSQIRDFLDSWEAVSVIGIEHAARQLGVLETELFRRAQLGLDNGLDFAAVKTDPSEKTEGEDCNPEVLLDAAKTFPVSPDNMMSLDLARRALRRQFEAMVNLNPLRFMRVWMPWMAIVEGYCERLENSRFRLRFKKCCEDVGKRLETGELRLPLLW